MKKLTVVQHNELIEASYQLDIDQMRLINLALTKIDSRKKNIGLISIYPDEFVKMYDLNDKNAWRNIRNAFLGILQKTFNMPYVNKKGELVDCWVNWLVELSAHRNPDISQEIKIEFSPKIEPYLFELSGKFTQINFEYASKLNTPFSFRLYQWFIREHTLKRGQYYELVMTVKEIKKRALLDKSYSEWCDFRRWVIQPAIDAINQKTNLSVTYEIIKRRNKAHSIRFTYIDEMQQLLSGNVVELSNQKPIRPRLIRRPKVTAGSHAEGEWQKENLKLLAQYQTDLQAWDSESTLTMPDLKKLIEYSKLFNTKIHAKAKEELKQRKGKV